MRWPRLVAAGVLALGLALLLTQLLAYFGYRSGPEEQLGGLLFTLLLIVGGLIFVLLRKKP